MPYGATPSTSVGPELPEESSPELWRSLTERVELPQPSASFSGFGSFQNLTLERLGVVAEANVRVTVKVKVKAAAKFAAGMPNRILKNLALQANGVSGVISCSGTVLESRQRAVYRGPEHAVLLGAVEPGGEHALGTEITFDFIAQVPISEDLRELQGAALAQSEETQLSLALTWASLAEILESGELEGITGTVEWFVTWFSIGTAQTKKGSRVIVLPDLSELHGLVEREQEINASAGNKESPLTRASGDLLRYFASVRDGAHTTVDPLTGWNLFQIKYGGNQTPITYQVPAFLVERNARDYRVRPDVNGVHYVILDTTLDDALRDAIRPMALSELKSIIGLEAAPEAGSAVLTAQENLYPQGT